MTIIIVIFQISTLKFLKVRNFAKIQDCINLGPKMRYLDVFFGRILNNYSHIGKQRSQFLKLQNFKQKQKHINFRPNMPYSGIFFGKNFIVLPYLKSGPSDLSNCKISRKNNLHKFGTKYALFGYIWGRTLNSYSYI